MSEELSLFVYWEGPLPRWVAACVESLRASLSRRVRLRFVHPGGLHRLVPGGLPEHLCRVRQPAHRADWARAQLLARFGGFYFDADTVGLRCPSELAGERFVHTAWTRPPRRVPNGYAYAPPGCPVAAAWADGVDEAAARLCEKGEGVPWTALGEGVLTPLAAEMAGRCREVPLATFLPVDVDADPAGLFAARRPRDAVRPESVCFGLNHSWMMHNRRADMERDGPHWRRSRLLVHQLLAGEMGRVGA